jgi:hypothetical protein
MGTAAAGIGAAAAEEKPAVVSQSPSQGGAPVAGSQREDAPWSRIDIPQLWAVATPPIDAMLRRIDGWPVTEDRSASAPDDGSERARVRVK